MSEKNNLEGKAICRYVRISPDKVRRIADQIRGQSFQNAVIILKFMPYKSCPLLFSLISSAVSNAKQKSGLDENSFFISEVRVDEASFLKRFVPHAQGRGFPIKKRMCHITSSVFNSLKIFIICILLSKMFTY